MGLLPEDLGGNIQYRFSSEIPASLDQKLEYFSGNPGLCGRALKNLCYAPATLSNSPFNSTTSPPAIAAIPNTLRAQAPIATTVTNKNGSTVVTRNQSNNKGLKPGAFAAIVVKNQKDEVKNGDKLSRERVSRERSGDDDRGVEVLCSKQAFFYVKEVDLGLTAHGGWRRETA
ncbi:hypothetical protein AMTR_s00023p00063940, partial [Amborella trichopoda]